MVRFVLLPTAGDPVQLDGQLLAGGSTKRKAREERWYEVEVYRLSDGEYAAAVHYRTTRRLQETGRCWVFRARDRQVLGDMIQRWALSHDWREPLVLTGDPKGDVRRERIAEALSAAFETALMGVLARL